MYYYYQFIYLKGREEMVLDKRKENGVGGERACACANTSLHWLIPQMVITVMAKLGQIQDPGTLCLSPKYVAGASDMNWHFHLGCQHCKQQQSLLNNANPIQ